MTEETATGRPLPQITDRLTWQAKIYELRGREKAHTRAGDALAAERRRLPMVEVDPQTPLIGAHGPVPLIDVFDGRSQLIAYFFGNTRPRAGRSSGVPKVASSGWTAARPPNGHGSRPDATTTSARRPVAIPGSTVTEI